MGTGMGLSALAGLSRTGTGLPATSGTGTGLPATGRLRNRTRGSNLVLWIWQSFSRNSFWSPSREALLRALWEAVDVEPPETFQGQRLWAVARKATSGAD